MSRRVLPAFQGAQGGSGCANPDCDASSRHLRVLSELEMDRAYPVKEELPQWPFPPQATHACDSCGYCYQEVEGQLSLVETDTTNRPEISLDDWDWEPDMVYDDSIRESIEALINGAPDDVGRAELEEAVFRWIPGAGTDDARLVASEMDVDLPMYPADEFM